ncbi:MAG: efflux RND transporter permease subunit [Colwellia sp.]
MHMLTSWFIRNPVAANLLMALILFIGVMTTMSIRIEGFPRVPPETIYITSIYEGSTAGQVDDLVTQKIENALEGIEGVRSISSNSTNGLSQISVRRSGGHKLQKLLDDVRLKVDGIYDLPEKVRRPVIETGGFDFPALYLNIHGDTDAVTLQTLAQRLKEEMLAQPELSRLTIWGLHERELKIEVNPQLLLQYNLTILDVVQKIRVSSLDFMAGSLRTTAGNIYLRADNRAQFSTEFAAIPIVESSEGSLVLLSSVAKITDGYKDGDYLFRFNGQATVGIEVLVGNKENLLNISEVVHKVVDEFTPQLPLGVSATIWGDSSNYIADRLALLRSNGVQGLLLVSLILSLFLNVRLAFWVAMGIPISVMGAIAVAGSKWVDYSLNDVTTFGLIIALGILVDDAVVVGESVFEERKKIADPIKGTEAGVSKVAVATVFGVLTTVAAFFPMLLLDNSLGKILAGFSGIVILALLFSLLESKFILPAHLANIDIETKPRFLLSRLWAKIQAIAKFGLFGFRDRIYAPMLKAALVHRYATVVLFIAAATFGLGMMYLGKIQTVFFPDVPGQIITVNIEMDPRAPFSLTKSNVEYILGVGEQLNLDLKSESTNNQAPIRTTFILISSATSAHIYAELTPVSERPDIEILSVVNAWQKRTGQLEGVSELQFTGSEALAGGFQLKLESKDDALLKKASDELGEFLLTINGVSNIRQSLSGGQPELQVKVKPQARNLGFSTETLATQIGYAFGGAEVQKAQRDGEELKVIVRNGISNRDSIDDFLQTLIRSDSGEWVPLQAVAEIESGYVASNIYRQNGKMVNYVSASIDRKVVAPEEIGQAVFERLVPVLASKYPSVKIKAGGELEEMGEIKGGMKRALMLAAVLIYVLMAIPLKSYWQPVIILAIVPFGFICAALGHLIMNVPLSLLSFFGMLALTGVVINDSLVIMTRYNQTRAQGESVSEALYDAGVGRFQAIFLTTATTVIGLTPLLMETSEQAQYLIPAAVSLAFGELFSTLLMLLLMPVLIAITEDVKSFFRKAIFVPVQEH